MIKEIKNNPIARQYLKDKNINIDKKITKSKIDMAKKVATFLNFYIAKRATNLMDFAEKQGKNADKIKSEIKKSKKKRASLNLDISFNRFLSKEREKTNRVVDTFAKEIHREVIVDTIYQVMEDMKIKEYLFYAPKHETQRPHHRKHHGRTIKMNNPPIREVYAKKVIKFHAGEPKYCYCRPRFIIKHKGKKAVIDPNFILKKMP